MSDFNEVRYAIRKEDLNNVTLVFKQEYVEFSDDMGWTPLHWACGYNKNIEIVQFLLNMGCDLEAETSNNKWRPIHLAVFNGSPSIVSELINRGCLINAQTARGETPLDVAVEWKKDECEKILRKSTIAVPVEDLKQISSTKRPSISINTVDKVQIPSLTDYKKGILLGRGGFGCVYKCFDVQYGRDFALKEVLLNTDSSINKEVKCLENEIIIYSKLNYHPRIVQYFGAVQDQNSMNIFMEYMAGGSIKDQLTVYGPFTTNVIVRYVKQILEGLVFLHHKMIIHRDIKASNIMRDIDGNVKLGDFGTSRYLQTISLNSISRTNTGFGSKNEHNNEMVTDSFCGTFYWMAPEVIRGERYNISADVWSLGATVVEMLTGNHPYHDLEPYAALFRIGTTSKIDFQPPQPLSKEFKSFINKMFVPNPNKRASVEALLKSEFIVKGACK